MDFRSARQALQDSGGSSRPSRREKKTYKSFDEMVRGERAVRDDLERWVYPSLTFGAIFRISGQSAGFGKGKKRPWVIIEGYQRGRKMVRACPMTTQIEPEGDDILFVPAGLTADLKEDAIILLRVSQQFYASNFRDTDDFEPAGELPAEWQEKLSAALIARARRITGEIGDS